MMSWGKNIIYKDCTNMENRRNKFENFFNKDSRQELITLSDGKLCTEDGRIFHIHKYVLASRSSYFYALFCGMGRGRTENVIPGIEGEVLSDILFYIYSEYISITEENIFDLMVASDYLLLDDLFLRIKMVLRRNLSPANSFPILMFALSNNRFEILSETYRFVQTHFENFVCSQDCNIGDLSVEILKELLSDRNLHVRSEKTVWLAIIKWVEADRLYRLPCVPDLIMNLTVSDLQEDLASGILLHDIVAQNPFCREIREWQSSHPNSGNLDALKNYIQAHINATLSSNNDRQPKYLNYSSYSEKNNIQVYLTYDENIDLWPKILELDIVGNFVLPAKERIFTFGHIGIGNRYYDVITERWYSFADFIIPRYEYWVVELNRCIYVMGGALEETDRETYDVEIYNWAEDMWQLTQPMIPVSWLSAVIHNNSIYVVGHFASDAADEMVAQVYDPTLRTWNALPSPSTVRQFFAMIVYHEKIYVLGGYSHGMFLKDVEVFDTVKREWNREEELPYKYYQPRAMVLNGYLFVYECSPANSKSPVQWNFFKKQ